MSAPAPVPSTKPTTLHVRGNFLLAKFKPNGTAEVAYRTPMRAVGVLVLVEPVRITDGRITSRWGDVFTVATGTWKRPRKAHGCTEEPGGCCKVNRWLVSVTPEGSETKTYRIGAQRYEERSR